MIQLINVQKSYGSGTNALSDINLDIKRGEFLFVTGASGSGKTTLLKLLYCREKPSSGQIFIDGVGVDRQRGSETPYLRRKIGVIFQDFKLLEGRSVFENVSIPLDVMGFSKPDIIRKVRETLDTVRLHGRTADKVSSLSGGEQQKVAVARAIINDPLLILADEPTGSLDKSSGDEIMEILRSLNSKGATIVFATHNRSLIKEERVVVLENGRILN